MDGRLGSLAAAHHGVFTSALAATVDVDDTMLRRLERSGEVVRVRRDAYVVGELWEPATPEGRLALRARAVLAGRPRDVATYQSALALHGLPLHGVPMTTVDVAGDVERVRLRSGLRTHPRASGGTPVQVEGVSCASIADAAAQVLVREGLVEALVPVDAALHAGRLDGEALSHALDQRCTTPRLRVRGEALLGRADPACESVGETLTRSVLVDAALDVRSQVDIRDGAGFVGRVDLLVAGRVVVEFDGAVKYGGADGRSALVAEKRREDRLRALGYAVVRVTWADLHRAGWVVAQVRQALAQLFALGARTPAS